MKENIITPERRHDIRYHVQYFFIPELVECVNDGYLPYISLFPSTQWYISLMDEFDLEELNAAKVYEGFEKIEVDEEHLLILYTFPEPEEVPEAAYGAVLLDISSGIAEYYTLEASYDDQWAVCSKNVSGHSLFGFWDSADKDRFVEWVKERIQG